MGITIEQLKKEYPNVGFENIKSIKCNETDGSFLGNNHNIQISDNKIVLITCISDYCSFYSYITPTKEKNDVTIEELCSNKIKIISTIEYPTMRLGVWIYNNLGKTINIDIGFLTSYGDFNITRASITNNNVYHSGNWGNLTETNNEITFLKYPPFLLNLVQNKIIYGISENQLYYTIVNYNGVYDSNIPDEQKALIYNSVFLDTDNPRKKAKEFLDRYRPYINIPQVLFPVNDKNELNSAELFNRITSTQQFVEKAEGTHPEYCTYTGREYKTFNLHGTGKPKGVRVASYLTHYIIDDDFIHSDSKYDFLKYKNVELYFDNIEANSSIEYTIEKESKNAPTYTIDNKYTVIDGNSGYTPGAYYRYFTKNFNTIYITEINKKLPTTNIFNIFCKTTNNSYIEEKMWPRAKWHTNIPIFFTKEEAEEYVTTGKGLINAINYGGIKEWNITNKYSIDKNTLYMLSAASERLCLSNQEHQEKKIKDILSNLSSSQQSYLNKNLSNLPIVKFNIQKNVLTNSINDAYFYCETKLYDRDINKDKSKIGLFSNYLVKLDHIETKDSTLNGVHLTLCARGYVDRYPGFIIYGIKFDETKNMPDYNFKIITKQGYGCGDGAIIRTETGSGYIYNLIDGNWDYTLRQFSSSNTLPEPIEFICPSMEINIDTNIPFKIMPGGPSGVIWGEKTDTILTNLPAINNLYYNKQDYQINKETIQAFANVCKKWNVIDDDFYIQDASAYISFYSYID